MSTLEERIQQIEAKDEIRELTALYCHAVVDGEPDKIVSLFCVDGVFKTHNIAPCGRAELTEFYQSGVSKRTHKPFIQNHVIELTSDYEAIGRCSVEIRVNQDGEPYTQSGHYLDQYKKVDGNWKFKERHYHRYHNAPWRDGWKLK